MKLLNLNTQMTLRGVRCEPSSAEIRKLVLSRLEGFEWRQEQRQLRRDLANGTPHTVAGYTIRLRRRNADPR